MSARYKNRYHSRGLCRRLKRGDTVSLIDDKLSVLWMADLLDCNVDEIVCSVSKRVPRIYEN